MDKTPPNDSLQHQRRWPLRIMILPILLAAIDGIFVLLNTGLEKDNDLPLAKTSTTANNGASIDKIHRHKQHGPNITTGGTLSIAQYIASPAIAP